MYCERGTVSIKRAANGGYIVCARDPAIEKANAMRSLKESKTNVPTPYISPEKEYAFANRKQLDDFLAKNLDKAIPEETYESAFEALSDD